MKSSWEGGISLSWHQAFASSSSQHDIPGEFQSLGSTVSMSDSQGKGQVSPQNLLIPAGWLQRLSVVFLMGLVTIDLLLIKHPFLLCEWGGEPPMGEF